ncbi:MAG TPA: hypothetical protein VNL98_02145 [Gemmatimonadales bacterium]|nr:hypothetical protein [Gemmatimonadales bacterium]
MSRRLLNSVLLLALIAGAGCRSGQQGAAPEDPFVATAIAPIPVGSLAGSSALLMTVGAVLVSDSQAALRDLEPRRTVLLEAANAQLDSALRRDAREVRWMGLAEQRRAARQSPALGLDPDRVATSYIVSPRLAQVPDPLWSQLRSLAALTGARYAIVPPAVRFTGSPGAVRASYLLAAVDTRTGAVVWRGRLVGSAQASAEAALAAAAATAVAPLVPNH